MLAGRVGRVARWLAGDTEPAGSASHRLGRSDMTVVWRRLRVPAGASTLVAGLTLAVLWRSLRLLEVAALSALLLAENWWQLRRRSQSACVAVGLDATLFSMVLALLGVSPFLWTAPFLYSAITAIMLMSWGRILLAWAYDLVLVGLLFGARQVLPAPSPGRRPRSSPW